MKRTWIALTILLGALLGALVPTVTQAATPELWMYAAIQPSRLGTVEAVQASFFSAQAKYAEAHDGCWNACYEAVVTEWLNAHGCASCYVKDNQLSFKIKVDAPNYLPTTAIMPPNNPQPWMYGAVNDSGLLTVDRVQRSFFGAQVDYANAHGGCWDACYEAVATEWLNAHGCSNCYVKDFQLSFKVKIDAERNKPQ